MDDHDSEQLLLLLDKYVSAYDTSADMTIEDLTEDLAMSMDVTSDRADSARANIQANFTH